MKRRYVMRETHRDMRGFEYLLYSMVAFVLVFVLVFIPVAPALASEEVAEGAPGAALSAESDVQAPTPEEDVLLVTEVATEAETFVEENVTELAEGETGVPDSTAPGEQETEVLGQEFIPMDEKGDLEIPEVAPADVSSTTDSEADTSGSTVGDFEAIGETPDPVGDTGYESIADDTITTTEDSTEKETEDVPIAGEAEEDGPIPLVIEEPETAHPEESVIAMDSAGGNSNFFSFRKEECAALGDGTFYCSTATTAPMATGIDRVFSAADADGDKEIYVEKKGEVTAVTKNLLDDDAPYYDERSETIVWHRLVDGRYQIVSYDVQSGEETVLTHDRYNNMEPSRYGDSTVWQGWVGNDWEIMLLESGEITMLTDNTWNDVAPSVNGAYIVWQSFEAGAWRVKVYDTATEETTTIDDAEGASIENPRFVLVYDSKYGNGDVETRGYDLERKTSVPLSATPSPIPESIPDPDQTGEDRALIQTITQLKPKGEGEADILDEDEPNPDHNPGTTTPEDISDLVIPPAETSDEDEDYSVIDTASTTVVGGLSSSTTEHIEDVIMRDNEDAEHADSTSHIEDVIVTPFAEPLEDASDSQATVASST